MAGTKSRKDMLIKKAIREVATKKKIIRKKVTNNHILEYMLDNKLGTKWVTIGSIKKIRMTLPEMYRDEF